MGSAQPQGFSSEPCFYDAEALGSYSLLHLREVGFAGGPVTVSADLSEVWVSSEAFDEVLDVGNLEELPEPEYNLNVGSGSHAYQTGRIMEGVEDVIQKERCGLVLVEGDTNTVLAGSLAAVKLHVAVGPVEAGLRCYDRSMPEEINRVVSDHLSDLLFAPTETSKANLLREGVAEEKISVTVTRWWTPSIRTSS